MLKKCTLKAFQACDSEIYNSDKFVLVFARDSKEAKQLAGKSSKLKGCPNIFVGFPIKNKPWLMNEALSDEPHVVENPRKCKVCEAWGQSEIGEDGYCESCRSDMLNGYIG